MGVCGIYAITHAATGRRYIGQSGDMGDRLRHHRKALVARRHPNVRLQRAVDKYGIEAFTFEPLIAAAPKMLTFYEQRLMDGFDAVQSGFNIAPAADSTLGTTRSPEQRARISESQRKSRERPEVVRASAEAVAAAMRRPEVRAAISRATTSAMSRPEVRAAFMDAIGKPEYREPRIAAARSPERRAAVSESVRAAYARPDVIERHRAACTTPEYTAKHRAANQAPELRAARAAAAKAAWADPEKRAARVAAIRRSKQKAAAQWES